MTPKYNENLKKLFHETGRDKDPFRNVETLNTKESSECKKMLEDMGVKIIPMADLPNVLTHLFEEHSHV